MPEFALKLSFFLYFWLQVLGSRLKQEPHLCTHAEVRDGQDRQLAEEGFSAELDFVLVFLKELFHRNRLNLHYVANVQIVDPFVLIEKSEHTTHVGLFFLQVVIVLMFVVS